MLGRACVLARACMRAVGCVLWFACVSVHFFCGVASVCLVCVSYVIVSDKLIIFRDLLLLFLA